MTIHTLAPFGPAENHETDEWDGWMKREGEREREIGCSVGGGQRNSLAGPATDYSEATCAY